MYGIEDKICLIFGESGVVAKKFFQVWNTFSSAEELIAEIGASTEAKKLLGDCYAVLRDKLRTLDVADITAELERNGVVAVTYFSTDYPDDLRYIDDPPYILYCKGNASLLRSDCLAVIGTRKVSSYGKRIAKDFTSVLSEYFTIVSGLAYGVDSIAHETTLDENGATIAVLGGGLLNVYPAANQGLANRIVGNGGLIVSEYGLRAAPMSYHFPHRNRIVSGLSKGVLVCQAPLKSGTNSTVELALDQGKDVFVVPGEIYDFGFGGSNSLIKTMQGACVTSPRDIVSFYNLELVDEKKRETYQLNIDEQQIVNALSAGAKTFDQLVENVKMSPAELNFLLANLELKSIIARLPGNCYRLYGGIE